MTQVKRTYGRAGIIACTVFAVLCACMLLFFAHPAYAATSGNYTYTAESDGSVTIVACNKNASGDIVVPSTLGNKPVKRIGPSAFEECRNVTSVSLPDSVTSIDEWAFAYCVNLSRINLPHSINRIGYCAFIQCISLKEAKLPNSLTAIENGVFAGCGDLSIVTFPPSITNIGDTAFKECESLAKIELPKNLKTIDRMAFTASGLRSVTLPDSVTSIATGVFSECPDLEKVYVPASVKTMGDGVFQGSTRLNTIYYAGSVADWKKISVGKGNEALTSTKLIPQITGIPELVPAKPATTTNSGTKPYYKLDGQLYENESCTKPITDLTSWKTIPKIKTVKLSATSYTYNGKVKTPALTIKDAKGNKIASKYYTVKKSSGRKNVGTYTYKITFKGNYSGTKTLSFKINPKGTSVKSFVRAKKSFTVTWSKQASEMSKSRITGYQVRYSLKSNMTKATTKTVKGYASTKLTVKKLKAKKRYYVQVRTYMKVSGKTYYSAWSKTKSVMTN